MNRRTEFDTGSLSGLKGDIDLALSRGQDALNAVAAGDDSGIQAAQAHLRQAHGALQVVGLDGVACFAEELDGLLADIARNAAADASGAIAAAGRAYAGIGAYLDELMAGAPNQPLRLFPLYRDLRNVRAADARDARGNADPVDLYFPNLSFRPPRRDQAPVPLQSEHPARYFRDQCSRYQRGYVAWLKGEAAGAEDMRAAIDGIEQTQDAGAQRAFWWATAACLDAIARNALPSGVEGLDMPWLCNRIETQIRRLADGAPEVAERLLREVLYAIALARPASERIRLAQQTCRLASTLRGWEAAVAASPSAAHEAALRTKHAWSRHAAQRDSDSLAGFCAAAATLAQSAAALRNADLAALCAQIARVGEALSAEPGRMSEALAVETATALLLVKNVLEGAAADPAALGAAFGEHSRFVCTRLKLAVAGRLLRTAPGIALIDELSRQAQEELIVDQVNADMQARRRVASAMAPPPAPQAADQSFVQLGDARVSTTVFTLFSGEARALVGTLEAEHETLNMHGIVSDEMLRAAHALAGIADTVQLGSLSELAHSVERVLEKFASDTLGDDEQALIGDAVETLSAMVECVLEVRVPERAAGLVARLEAAAQGPAGHALPPKADPQALLPEEEGALLRQDEPAAALPREGGSAPAGPGAQKSG